MAANNIRTVFKYTLLLQDKQTLQLPIGAHVLDVQLQHGNISLWALVDPDAERETRTFVIVGTGHEFTATSTIHIATIQSVAGQLVWHVFEIP